MKSMMNDDESPSSILAEDETNSRHRAQRSMSGGRKTWAAAGSIQLKETEGSRTEALGAQVDHGRVCVRVHVGGM